MGGFQNDRWRNSCFKGLFPAQGAEAPFIAGLEAGKLIIGDGGDQVITPGFGKSQKFLGHHCANDVPAGILRAGMAVAVPVKAGHRIGAARLEGRAEYVFCLFHNYQKITKKSSGSSGIGWAFKKDYSIMIHVGCMIG